MRSMVEMSRTGGAGFMRSIIEMINGAGFLRRSMRSMVEMSRGEGFLSSIGVMSRVSRFHEEHGGW